MSDLRQELIEGREPMTYRGYRIEYVTEDFYRAFNKVSGALLTTGVTEQQVRRAIDAFLGGSL